MSDYVSMMATGWPINLTAQKVTIPASGSASELIPMQGKALVGLVMPAAWTAAAIQYYASLTPALGDLKVVKDTSTGNLMQTLVAADDWIVFPLSDAVFTPYLQLVSVTATTVTPVAQGAARDIILLLRNFLD